MSEQAKPFAARPNAEVLVDRPGLRMIRFALGPGEALSPHFAPRDVAIVVVAGSGRVTVDERVVHVRGGSVVALAGERHGITAEERLEFVVVQAQVEAGHAQAPFATPAQIAIDVGWPSR
ncbi:MAG: hypothetical protein A2138_18480 [Deltaproteobacteria bacterium RBG_16_71_12]|nr:MAG: hypothetical protein A2138_18480 [Deltaproteobacteria bacterium RBG_16_71_12]